MEPPTSSPRPSPLDALRGLLDGGWCATRTFAEVRAGLPDESFVEVDGRELYVEQAGAGEPILLLHGLCCSSYTWRDVLPGLAERFRVIAPDLPGFGYSQRPEEPEAYRFPALEGTILGLADRLGLESFHLVGHSFGGALALWLTERHPWRVRSLTLVATALPELTAERRQGWARFRALNWLFLRSRLLRPGPFRRALEGSWHDASRVTAELVEAYRQRLLVEGLEDAYFGLLAPVDEPVPEVALESISTRVLVLWGDDDRVIPLERAMQHLPRLPRARFVILERCGHLPMEESPEALLRELVAFLEGPRRSWLERLVALARDQWASWGLRRQRPAPLPVGSAEAEGGL